MTQNGGDSFDEKALIAKAQEGDHEAFAFIVKKYKDRVFNTAIRYLGNFAIAEELTQEVFITVFRKIGTFQGKSKFSTWLYRITVNHAKNRIGYLSRRGYYRNDELQEYITGDDSIDIIPRTTHPDDYTQDRELMGVLYEKLSKLKNKDREIIILKEFEGLNYEEIGKILNINIGTVKSRLSRARLRLKTLLVDYL